MTDPWKYRLVWRAGVARDITSHPGRALHRTKRSLAEHAKYLLNTGIRDLRVERWENGDWWPVGGK